MPKAVSVSEIKSKLLQPALTSYYEVLITPPAEGFINYLKSNKLSYNSEIQSKIQLACSEALLPGSSFATSELNNDRTGVTERHVHRRVYDDRIDLTFYVDAGTNIENSYASIRFFEYWMKFITNESIGGIPTVKDPNFSYQIKYPKEYYGGLKITKFERTGHSTQYGQNGGFHTGATLGYNFVNVYPTAIASIPISYDTSSLLKCTVSLSYIRYYLDQDFNKDTANTKTPNFNLTPQQLANINSQAFNPNINLSSLDGYTAKGGIPFDAAAASGRTISVTDAYSGNYNLNLQ